MLETHIIVAADLSNQAADNPQFQDIHKQVDNLYHRDSFKLRDFQNQNGQLRTGN
jgi:hypothetical protein